VGGDDRHRVRGDERRPPRDELVEDAAEGVQVGARVDGVAASLLRREVVRRADDRAGAGRDAALVAELRDAEVEDLREVLARARLHQHDVARLHVAVDDARVVRLGERAEHLLPDLRGPRLVDRPPIPEHLREVLPRDVLHREVEPVVVGGGAHLAEVEHADRVRVREARDDPRLGEEALHRALLAREVAAQDLERERLPHPDVLRLVDGAHPALADQREEAISVGDHPAREAGRRGARATGGGLHARAARGAEVHRPRARVGEVPALRARLRGGGGRLLARHDFHGASHPR
jgi:hypothetical protein